MKASTTTLDDGTVTIVIESETNDERQLLAVFYAQTYRESLPASVLKLGPSKAQLIPFGRVAGEST